MVDWLFYFYKIVSPIKNLVLRMHFGFVAECKHTPSCSVYMRDKVREEGWKGLIKGFRRVLSCW
ncbi:MAG: membrane protein insertion efficiency factor YidD [Pseudomonadales bacterium]|nr:membrane protein insertion efficiency factor YidD [Pseudomonadales bacterium]